VHATESVAARIAVCDDAHRTPDLPTGERPR